MVIIKEERYFLLDRMGIENIVISVHPDRDYFDDDEDRKSFSQGKHERTII